jgi:hypothetical protein
MFASSSVAVLASSSLHGNDGPASAERSALDASKGGIRETAPPPLDDESPATRVAFRERMMGLEPTTFCMASRSNRTTGPYRASREADEITGSDRCGSTASRLVPPSHKPLTSETTCETTGRLADGSVRGSIRGRRVAEVGGQLSGAPGALAQACSGAVTWLSEARAT